jgi:hypothetical protein
MAGVTGAQCQLGDLSTETRTALFHTLRTVHPGYSVARFQLDKTLSFLRAGGCRSINAIIFEQLIDGGLSNPLAESSPAWRQMLLQQRAQLRLAQLRPDDAFDDLLAAAVAVPSLDGMLASSALLGRAGHPAHALRFLDSAPVPAASEIAQESLRSQLRMDWLSHTKHYQREFSELHRTIEADLATHKQYTQHDARDATD